MWPKPNKAFGPAGPSDPSSLADLADKISETAKETFHLCEQIARTLKERDLLVDKTRIFAHCTFDACCLLARQLRDLSSHDEALLKLENEKFWPNLRCVMDLWKENSENIVDLLKRDPRIQTNLVGKFVRGLQSAVIMAQHGPPQIQGGTAADIQLVTTLFALHKEMQKDLTLESRPCRHFLSCDLESKATQNRMRTIHTRQSLILPLEWGQTHSRLVDVSLDLASRAKEQLGEPESDWKLEDEGKGTVR